MKRARPTQPSFAVVSASRGAGSSSSSSSALAADARAGLVAGAARAATGAMHGVDTAAGPLSPQLLGATAAGAAVLRLPPGSAVPVLSSVALAAPFTMNSGGGDASHVLLLEAAGPHLIGLACPRFVEWRGSG